MDNKVLQPTYKRQRFLLAFVRQLNEKIAMINLQKLVFLYMMSEKLDYYDFVPYRYGPYSFQLEADVTLLVKNGFLSCEAPYYWAKEEGQDKTSFSIASERGGALLRRAYQDYPYYTIKSAILDRYFSNDPTTLERLKNERQRYIKDEQILFTIGYEGRSLEAFMNVLLRNGIYTLCDVRKNSFSRKFGFSKDSLQRVSAGLGIKYIHLPELGINSSKRKNLDSTDDYKILFEDFRKSLPSLHNQLEELYLRFCSDNRIALMCFEKEPEMCHRHVIRDYLCALYPIRSVDL